MRTRTKAATELKRAEKCTVHRIRNIRRTCTFVVYKVFLYLSYSESIQVTAEISTVMARHQRGKHAVFISMSGPPPSSSSLLFHFQSVVAAEALAKAQGRGKMRRLPGQGRGQRAAAVIIKVSLACVCWQAGCGVDGRMVVSRLELMLIAGGGVGSCVEVVEATWA